MLVKFLICGLATWRISHMLVHEAGPFRIFTRLRSLCGIEHDGDIPVAWPTNCVLSCTWCTAVWIAAAMWFMPEIISGIFAIASITCFIEGGDNGPS